MWRSPILTRESSRWEGAIGLLLYCAYIVSMFFNRAILSKLDALALWLGKLVPFSWCSSQAPDLLIPEDDFSIEMDESALPTVAYMDSFDEDAVDLDDLEGMVRGAAARQLDRHMLNTLSLATAEQGLPSEVHQPPAPRGVDTSASKFETICWMLVLPFRILFRFTIPPIKGPLRYQYFASFFLSAVWVAALTYLIVYWSHRAGCLLGITDGMLGVTVLAIGTRSFNLSRSLPARL